MLFTIPNPYISKTLCNFKKAITLLKPFKINGLNYSLYSGTTVSTCLVCVNIVNYIIIKLKLGLLTFINIYYSFEYITTVIKNNKYII